jgi:hypothetical protein
VAKLILGPLLRRVTGNQAVIWLQTDSDTEVTVIAGEARATVRTKEIHGIHLALPVLSDLPEGRTPYVVQLDGEQVWPLPEFPASTILVGTGEETRIAFGSCREPFAHGTDALAAFAERARTDGRLPDLLALIGDQIYADIPHRPRVTTFEDYVALYHEAWSPPAVRWLLSTIPTIMIFDDHEIIDDWNSSARWLGDIQQRSWWKSRISAGLTSYHLFQHLGNLTPAELARADWTEPPQRWGYTVDIGRTRLIMLDCRGSRVLTGKRRMFPQDEWDRLAQDSQADCDHLLIACSLPWLLAPAIDLAEHVVEQLSERHGGRVERFRRKYDLEHWAAVGDSFAELTEVIKAVRKPSTVSVLGGDVHHSYVVQALFPGTPKVHQLTCSPLNNSVSWVMRSMLKTAWATPFPHGLVKRKRLMKPFFGNAIATLSHRDRTASVSFESPGADGQLATIFTKTL